MDTLSDVSKKLNIKTIFHVYLRSFFFQGSFSIKDRQNVGFAFCMEPVGRTLWTSPSDRAAFLLRHTEFFNGNPFMTPLVLGAVANMEERLANAPDRLSGSITADDISQFKAAVGQASGSVGDRFFWRTLRPFALAVGLLGSLAFGIWGAVLFLAIFSIPTIVLRWYWIDTGYRLGPKVVIALKNRNLDRSVKLMESVGGLIIPFFSLAFFAGSPCSFHWRSNVTVWCASAGGMTILLFILSVFLYSKLIPYEGFRFQVSSFKLQVSGLSIVVSITTVTALLTGIFLSFVNY